MIGDPWQSSTLSVQWAASCNIGVLDRSARIRALHFCRPPHTISPNIRQDAIGLSKSNCARQCGVSASNSEGRGALVEFGQSQAFDECMLMRNY